MVSPLRILEAAAAALPSCRAAELEVRHGSAEHSPRGILEQFPNAFFADGIGIGNRGLERNLRGLVEIGFPEREMIVSQRTRPFLRA